MKRTNEWPKETFVNYDGYRVRCVNNGLQVVYDDKDKRREHPMTRYVSHFYLGDKVSWMHVDPTLVELAEQHGQTASEFLAQESVPFIEVVVMAHRGELAQ